MQRLCAEVPEPARKECPVRHSCGCPPVCWACVRRLTVRLHLQVDSFIGDEGASVVADALRNNYTVKSLDMRGCNVRADGAGAHSLRSLMPAAPCHAPAFEVLILSGSWQWHWQSS